MQSNHITVDLALPDQIVEVRFRAEQPLEWVKDKHGFERCRYLELLRYGIQACFTFLMYPASNSLFRTFSQVTQMLARRS